MDENLDDRLVAAYLDALSRLEPGSPLPSADVVWDRGRVALGIERRRALVRRAVRPVVWVERGLGLVAAAAAGAWVWWRWDLVWAGSERLVALASDTGAWTLLGIAASLSVVAGIAADHAATALRSS